MSGLPQTGEQEHYVSRLYILSIFLGVIAPDSQAKDVKKSYPTRQRAAVMFDTSSGSKEDEMVRPGVEMTKQVYLIAVEVWGGGGVCIYCLPS